MAYQWNADDYRNNSSAQQGWAEELIGKLDLGGGERILDLGCGDGNVTASLAGRVPRGEVIGVDSSPEMIRLAQSLKPSGAAALAFRVMDARELDFVSEFDIVFSNAVLHWIVDHRPVLDGIRRALRPGGRLLLQMGGRGNAAGVLRALEPVIAGSAWQRYFDGFESPYGFHGPVEYKSWLAEAGLRSIRVELIPKDMVHTRYKFASWLRTTWLPYIHRVPETMREQFIEEVVESYLATNPADDQGLVHVGMVRIEVEALKPD